MPIFTRRLALQMGEPTVHSDTATGVNDLSALSAYASLQRAAVLTRKHVCSGLEAN